MAKFDIKSYIKNVVKSTGYIMTDVAKETNPIVTDFINTNSDTIKDMYSFVKDFKRNVGQKKEALADNEYAQLAKDTVHNFFDDIKTGKFYNVERSKSAEDELMRSMMGDDFNMDFDTDDWDFDENSSSSGFGARVSVIKGFCCSLLLTGVTSGTVTFSSREIFVGYFGAAGRAFFSTGFSSSSTLSRRVMP